MSTPAQEPRSGGLAAWCVEHREVSWMLLVAVLVWGAVAYTRLPQQEDPTIPERRALVVTHFPGANATTVEDLVTRKLEKKISELQSVEEMESESRAGVSVITVTLEPGGRSVVAQEWDKLRARLREVILPEGCQEPFLDTDFGNTLTLLFGLTSERIGEAECVARARLIRQQVARIRAQQPATNRATVVAFYPPSVVDSYRAVVLQKFRDALGTGLAGQPAIGSAVETRQGDTYILADFTTAATRAEVERFLELFVRRVAGTDSELHPDFVRPLVLMGEEDPYPAIRARPMFRHSYRELEKLAERLDDELKQLSVVGKVRQIGIVPEVLYLLFSTPGVSGYPLGTQLVMDSIAHRNAIIPGGVLRTEGQNFPVQVTGEFGDETELLETVVGLTPVGETNRAPQPLYLRDLFEVRRMYESPIRYQADVLTRREPGGALETRRAVLVGVEMKAGRIISHFGAEVAARVAAFRERLPEGVSLVTLSDQPRSVAQRIDHFTRCFLEAVLIVIVVALLLMDWRAALVVAAAIPLTVALTVAGMQAVGVGLHQISIAALIIALGMLVDDPVVASDAINRELHHGVPRDRAAWLGPVRLGRAILYATVINIVAFLPLVLLPGDKGAFIVALPAVVTLSLVSSRVVSMTFVPLLGYYLLRGQRGLEEGGEARRFLLFRPVDWALGALLPRYRGWLERGLERPGRLVAGAYGLLALSFGLLPFFGTQFFPPAERSQLLIDVELAPNTSIAQTRRTAAEVVRVVQEQPEVESAGVFTGGTAPRFYYNVVPREPGSHRAQVLVNTRDVGVVRPLLARLRQALDAQIAGARCVVRELEQGPPLEVPIQIRVTGDELDVLRRLADRVAGVLRSAGGYQVHDDLGVPVPTLQIDIDQKRANTVGIGNAQVGQVVRAAFSGIQVSELREGDHLVPIVIRLRVEERNEAEKIRTLYVPNDRGSLVPLDAFATVRVVPEYATIAHFGQRRSVTVKAFSQAGELPSAVLGRAQAGLRSLELPAGYSLERAGEARQLRESRQEMGLVMEVSLSLIALTMVLQFRSVMKSLVVMLTVPLGLIGAFVGLAVFQTSLGFMALLGMVSLAGVIVSHIIVLSDYIEEARAQGMELKAALVQAGLVRLRAVLVTVLATVGGLVPLAATGGELWRPLTAVHIFGLLFATALTLLLLPVLYYVFCARLRWIR